MPNIRNPDSYNASVWDWWRLNECFGGKIRASDIDGIVERNGWALILEAKRLSQLNELNHGQLITYAALHKLGATIMTIYGEPDHPVHLEVRWPGEAQFTRMQNINWEDIQRLCTRWYGIADSRRNPAVGKEVAAIISQAWNAG